MKKQTEICHYDSSMISSSFYNYETGKLLVEFHGGAVYEFINVASDHYKSFSESDSIGKGFNQYIRQYEGVKVEDEVAMELSMVDPGMIDPSFTDPSIVDPIETNTENENA
jgi:hypothetical protein